MHDSRQERLLNGSYLKKRVKRTFFIHHWCGLIAGIFILAISLSGIVLLFDDEVDRKVYSEYFVLDVPARALHIDNSIHWIRTQYSDWDIRIPALPEKKNDALLYELRKGQLRKWLFVHPETGKQIALLDQAHNRITYVALNIHYNLLAGTMGKLVVLLVGTVFLALTITGLILYRRSFWKVLSFRQRISFYSRRQFFSSLHRITGVWALAFNLLMCATGLALAISVVNAAFKPSVKVSVPVLTTSVDSIIVEAKSAYPDFDVNYLRFPLNDSGSIQLLGRMESDPVYYGKIYSKIPANFTTGELGTPNLLRDQRWDVRTLTSMHVIHFGDYAGLVVQWIYAFFGLMPAVLSISGFLTWRLRHRNLQRKHPQQKRVVKDNDLGISHEAGR